ncbi:hypothetical protein [Petrimonas sp.]|uniref:hypothetical protein n=1 Tax=Petrimonas sp. TaxID=2023866 RepID=UPI003F5150EB
MTAIKNENILMMFEEINEKLDRTNQQIEKIGLKQPEATESEKVAELKLVMENSLENQSKQLYAIENAIRTEKRKIEFTPTSTFGMVFFFSLMLILLAVTVWNYSLRNQNATLSDNDLKFRYIQMRGNATANDFAELDSLFYFSRNSKKIKALRKQVETFEKNVEERAKLIEREEQLKREKEELDRKISKNR